MLLNKEKSGLILIDVQEKLTPYILEKDSLIERCEWLIRLSKDLSIPVVVSEQYPKGLGKTIEPLQKVIKDEKALEKVHFSCYRDKDFIAFWQSLKKKQAVIIGIETHVCVLQTAMEMHNAGFEVFVVVDAVSARHHIDHQYALKRMKQAGISLITSEMVFFEWVRCAGTPEFKALSQSYLR